MSRSILRSIFTIHALCSAMLICPGLFVAKSRAAESSRPVGKEDMVAAIDAIAGEAISSGKSVGLSIGVERKGEIILARGYGLAEVENEVPATEHTVYRLGSITKQFTAVAILQLVEQGKLGLQDELTKFLPDYPTQGHEITIHHLLTHTSGIKSYTDLREKFLKHMRNDFTHEELIAMFSSEPFNFAPGEKFAYCNSGYYLLGVIIEKISGKTYEDYLKEHVFKPASLTETYYLSERPIVKHRAQGYGHDKGKLVNDEWLSMDNPFAAGSLGSTVADMLKWQRALNADKLISHESHENMMTPATLNNGEKTKYGYGLFIAEFGGTKKIEHGGGINGFQTELAYYPEHDVTIVVLANTEGAAPNVIEQKIAKKVMGLP